MGGGRDLDVFKLSSDLGTRFLRSGVVKANVRSSLQELRTRTSSKMLWPLAATLFSLPEKAPWDGDWTTGQRYWGLLGLGTGQAEKLVTWFTFAEEWQS